MNIVYVTAAYYNVKYAECLDLHTMQKYKNKFNNNTLENPKVFAS